VKSSSIKQSFVLTEPIALDKDEQ